MAETKTVYPTIIDIVGTSMSGTNSSSKPGSAVMRAQRIAASAIGAVWIIALLLRVLDPGIVDSASACRRMVYRDPVTGRERGIGAVRITANGTIRCRDVTYQPGTR
ncbi:hypothetical protein AB4Z10_18605 [Bosea sp. RAF48]|jgi:hypothetical protein|uniref:hypothetical protein n=1 Tax=Bosea sp. RAF48 TaxID=3237480 RepID=UPI003F8E4981